MPYILSHAAFAYTIGQRFNCFSDKESLSLFILGSQGPDIFFYDRLPPTPFIPNQKITGNLLHSVPCDNLVRILLSECTSEFMPFVYGFLTHIALDSTLHPYICAMHAGLDHTRFEGQIDSIYYHRFKDSVPFTDLFFIPKSLPGLDSLMNRLCILSLGRSIPGAYARSVRKMLRLFPVLFDPDGKRYKMLLKAEHFIGVDNALSAFLLAADRSSYEDCMNERHTVWHAVHFPEVPRTESVDDLFSDAALFAENLIMSVQSEDSRRIDNLCRNRTMRDGPLPI